MSEVERIFNHSNHILFHDRILELVEETRLRRVCLKEAELKIEGLEEENKVLKFDKNKECDEKVPCTDHKQLEDRCNEVIVEREKIKLQYAVLEEEVLGLRDELFLIKKEKVSLKSRIQELDSKLSIHLKAKELCLSKLEIVNNHSTSLQSNVTLLHTKLSHLTKTVGSCEKVQCALRYHLKHYKCLNDDLRRGLEKKNEEIIRLSVEVKSRPVLKIDRSVNDDLVLQLKNEKERRKVDENEISVQRSQIKTLTETLQSGQKSFMKISKMMSEEKSSFEDDILDLKEKLYTTERNLDLTHTQLEQKVEELSALTTELHSTKHSLSDLSNENIVIKSFLTKESNNTSTQCSVNTTVQFTQCSVNTSFQSTQFVLESNDKTVQTEESVHAAQETHNNNSFEGQVESLKTKDVCETPDETSADNTDETSAENIDLVRSPSPSFEESHSKRAKTSLIDPIQNNKEDIVQTENLSDDSPIKLEQLEPAEMYDDKLSNHSTIYQSHDISTPITVRCSVDHKSWADKLCSVEHQTDGRTPSPITEQYTGHMMGDTWYNASSDDDFSSVVNDEAHQVNRLRAGSSNIVSESSLESSSDDTSPNNVISSSKAQPDSSPKTPPDSSPKTPPD